MTANHRMPEETFNNAPITPPKTISPSKALEAAVPLHSSYLQSFADPPSTADTSFAAKPTSALPLLRKEDELRYWASLLSGASREEVETHHKSAAAFVNCGEHVQPATYTGVGRPKFMARAYNDFLVVGIVVLFLAAVIMLEAMEKFGNLWVPASCLRRRLQLTGSIEELLSGDDSNKKVQYTLKRARLLHSC